MEIELAPRVKAKMTGEADRLAVSPAELSTRILTDHTLEAESASISQLERADREVLFTRHIAWLKASSPGWETRDPYSVDWQAIKAEGRK